MPSAVFPTRVLQLAVCAGLAAFPQASSGPARQAPVPIIIREQQTVLVRGRPETWRLEWHGTPMPYCPASAAGALSCPCHGFAYGATGDLWLVRVSGGKEIDRLHLSPLFDNQMPGDSGKAILQRWPVEEEHDLDAQEGPAFEKAVTRRPVVKVMHFADYDHDGAATEFYLQTAALACGPGAVYGVVVGVSAQNPKLHALGTASRPDRPLYLAPFEWQALRQVSRSPVHVVGCPCGDFHCAGIQTEVLLRWSAAGIDGTQFKYECTRPLPGKPGRLVSRTPLAAPGDS